MNEIIILIIISLTEAFISPIPPDPLIIHLSIVDNQKWIAYSTIATIASTIGGVIGYYIGG